MDLWVETEDHQEWFEDHTLLCAYLHNPQGRRYYNVKDGGLAQQKDGQEDKFNEANTVRDQEEDYQGGMIDETHNVGDQEDRKEP